MTCRTGGHDRHFPAGLDLKYSSRHGQKNHENNLSPPGVYVAPDPDFYAVHTERIGARIQGMLDACAKLVKPPGKVRAARQLALDHELIQGSPWCVETL